MEEEFEEEGTEEGEVMTPFKHADPSLEETDESVLGDGEDENVATSSFGKNENEDENEEEESPEIEDCVDPNALHEKWGEFYAKCPYWSEIWVALKSRDKEWPKGLKLFNDRMYQDEKLCVPIMLQNLWIGKIMQQWGILGPRNYGKHWV
jgi:hypothetical protein